MSWTGFELVPRWKSSSLMQLNIGQALAVRCNCRLIILVAHSRALPFLKLDQIPKISNIWT